MPAEVRAPSKTSAAFVVVVAQAWLLLDHVLLDPFPLFSLSHGPGPGFGGGFDAVVFSGSPVHAIAPLFRVGPVDGAGNGTAAARIPLGVPVHVALTISDAGERRVYRDGVLVARSAAGPAVQFGGNVSVSAWLVAVSSEPLARGVYARPPLHRVAALPCG